MKGWARFRITKVISVSMRPSLVTSVTAEARSAIADSTGASANRFTSSASRRGSPGRR